jgi:hypothetical protein
MINGTASASVNVSTASTSTCGGTTVNFTATPINGGTAPSYQWKLNGANVGSNSSNYTNSTLNNNDQVAVVMTSNIGCATSNPATSSAVTMSISPTLTPTISVTSNPVYPSQGLPATFTSSVTNAGASPGYQWYKSGSPISGAILPVLVVPSPLASENYSVKLTSSYACATIPVVMSNYVSINTPLPVTLEWYTARPDNGKALLQWKTAQEYNNKQFIIERATNTNSNSYTLIGYIPALNAVNGSTYNFTDDPGRAGIYLYRLTQQDIDGNKKSLGIRAVNLEGKNSWIIQDLGSSWQLSSNQSFSYRLLDMQGRLLKASTGNGSIAITKPEPKGIYLLQLETGGELFTQKLLK